MATTVQFKRGTTANNDSFTGLVGEISIDTTLGTIRVHDGSTAGGSELALADLTNATVGGHLIPTADITYDLGSSSYRFRDIYLSGSTINLGGATISQDAGSGTIALVAAPTVDNPNPTALVVTSSGSTVAVDTTGGTVDFETVASEIESNPGFDGQFSSLTGTPTTISGYGITDAFDGAYSSLTGTPTIPSALTDLGISDGTNGQVLQTDGAGNFSFADASGGVSSYNDLTDKPTIPVVGTDALAYDSNLQSFVTTFTLPTSDGSANQVLVTNGSGTLSFADQSGGGGASAGLALAFSIIFG